MGLSKENPSLENQHSKRQSQSLETDLQDAQSLDSLMMLLTDIASQEDDQNAVIASTMAEEVVPTPLLEDLSELSELLSISSPNSNLELKPSTAVNGERQHSVNLELDERSLEKPLSGNSGREFSSDPQEQDSQEKTHLQIAPPQEQKAEAQKIQALNGDTSPSMRIDGQKQVSQSPLNISSSNAAQETSSSSQIVSKSRLRSQQFQYLLREYKKRKKHSTKETQSPKNLQETDQEQALAEEKPESQIPEPSSSNLAQDFTTTPQSETDQEQALAEEKPESQVPEPSSSNLAQDFTTTLQSETIPEQALAEEKPEKTPSNLEESLKNNQDKVSEQSSSSALPLSPSKQESSESVLKLLNFPNLRQDREVKQESIVLDSSELSHLHQVVNRLEKKLDNLANQVYQPTDLIDPLLPLIAELIQDRETESKSAILRVVTPVIDEVIQNRTSENHEAMSAAIANILPGAITKEIQDSPDEIAKAIAPEIATAIREQTRLEHNSISDALGPEMGKAIKTQIEVERDAMVDALYPVIGNTISKYMGEAIQSINQKVESALTPEGIQRKIRAKIQGVSEAELILKESFPFTTQAIFLIHKTSGLVIREIQPALKQPLEPNMMAGMLTAIRSFVNDCIAQPGEVLELDEIDYSDSKIVLEVAGYCYLAVVIKGEPTKVYRDKMRQIFSHVIQQYDQPIQKFEGDPETLPDSLQELLQQLIEIEDHEKASKPPTTLILIFLLLLGAFAIPWWIHLYRNSIDARYTQTIASNLEEIQPLSYSPIVPKVHRKKLTLKGRVPTSELKAKALEIAQQQGQDWEIENKIVVVKVPPDPVWIAAATDLVTEQLNQDSEVNINATYEQGTIILQGSLANITQAQSFPEIYQRIPGVQEIDILRLEPDALQKRIYFGSGATVVSPNTLPTIIVSLRQFLEINQVVHLKIIGHADPVGETNTNRQLALARANAVKQLLESSKIDPERLKISGEISSPPDVTPDQPYDLSRCVRFEVLMPPEKQEL